MEHYRQGDVLLVSISDIPQAAARIKPKRVILAEGEVTGHVHELVGGKVKVYEDSAKAVFLQIMEAPELRHAEHATQTIAPGAYRVIRQVEYEPQELRRVAD